MRWWNCQGSLNAFKQIPRLTLPLTILTVNVSKLQKVSSHHFFDFINIFRRLKIHPMIRPMIRHVIRSMGNRYLHSLCSKNWLVFQWVTYQTYQWIIRLRVGIKKKCLAPGRIRSKFQMLRFSLFPFIPFYIRTFTVH